MQNFNMVPRTQSSTFYPDILHVSCTPKLDRKRAKLNDHLVECKYYQFRYSFDEIVEFEENV